MYRLGAVLVFGAMAVTGATAAAAATPASTDSPSIAAAAVRHDVDALLRLHPGSRQVDPTSVEVGPGVVVTVPGPATGGTAPAARVGICGSGWVCSWQDAGYQGNRISFWYCGEYDLADYFLPDGSSWNDRISSVFNNQATHTAILYNWVDQQPWGVPGYPDKLYGQRPLSGTANLTSIGYNDMIDFVRPC
jgi:hypothetical protein